jgi:imidazolonepropionase-like amidohydrolase
VAATTNTTSLEVIRRGLSGRPATPPAAGESTAARGPGPRGRRPPRDAFDTGAESLANDWQEEGPPAEARSGAPAPSGPGSIADPLWEKVRGGELPVIINVNNAAAMLHVLKVVQPIEKARVLLVANAADVYQVRDAIKSSRVSLIVRPRLEKVANSAVRVNIARELNQAGIPFSFSLSANQADFQQSQDTPLFPVATLVRTGLDADLAVQALTKNPARALGIDQWVGSLEPKKQANLLVFDQDPLIGVGRLEQVYVEGKLVYENR